MVLKSKKRELAESIVGVRMHGVTGGDARKVVDEILNSDYIIVKNDYKHCWQTVISRLDLYDDVEEISDSLLAICDTLSASDAYWVKESAIQMTSMQGDFKRAVKILKRLNKSAVRKYAENSKGD